MKTLAFLLAGLVFLSTQPGYCDSAQDLFNEGQRAYVKGDLTTAKERFMTVLQLNPRHTASANYLAMITTAEKAKGGAPAREAQLRKVILPKVEFRDASLGSALDYLRQAVVNDSKGQLTVNFVAQVPADYLNSTKLTLSLANVPFMDVLGYVGRLTNVKFEVEQYAIAVKLAAAEAVAQTPADPKEPKP